MSLKHQILPIKKKKILIPYELILSVEWINGFKILSLKYKRSERYDFSSWTSMLTDSQGTCGCLPSGIYGESLENGRGLGKGTPSTGVPGHREHPSTPDLCVCSASKLQGEGPPEVETFLNQSFNFSPVDPAALTQSRVWAWCLGSLASRSVFLLGPIMAAFKSSVLSMWCLNRPFSWPPKGNCFKRKNFTSAKSQIMVQHRKSKGCVVFILKYKSLNAAKQQPPENVKFHRWG